jgi:hypothetical protein
MTYTITFPNTTDVTNAGNTQMTTAGQTFPFWLFGIGILVLLLIAVIVIKRK